MDKEYKQNKKYWIRMGKELLIARTLISKILCDHDYNSMMPKVIWDKFFGIDHTLDAIRNKAEERMWDMTPFHDTHIFYPGTLSVESLVDEFRQKVREAADGET